MTQAVALIFPAGEVRLSGIYDLARTFALEVVEGDDSIHPDAQEGLLHFRDIASPGGLILSIGPQEDPADAWPLADELINSRFTAVEPRILKFLQGLSGCMAERNHVYFVAADEWSRDDEVVFFTGTASDLVAFLTVNKSFNLHFWGPHHDIVRGAPRYPFAFQIYG